MNAEARQKAGFLFSGAMSEFFSALHALDVGETRLTLM